MKNIMIHSQGVAMVRGWVRVEVQAVDAGDLEWKTVVRIWVRHSDVSE